MAQPLTRTAYYRQRHEALTNDRSSWDQGYREIADYILPGAARFLPQNDTNRGNRSRSKIIRNVGHTALHNFAAGLHSSLTSPARIWFTISAPDPALDRREKVKSWCYQVAQTMRELMARSNLYRCLFATYKHLGLMATSCLHVDEDLEGKDLVRGYVIPAGLYCLALSEREQVDTCYRTTTMGAGALIRKFGAERVSREVRLAVEKGRHHERFEVLHLIEPNDLWMPGQVGPENMPWRSAWLQLGAGVQEDQFLRESGFEEFPVLAPRWDATGGDTYGTGPGHAALPDLKELQQTLKDRAKVGRKIVDPPMKAVGNLQMPSINPGDITYLPGAAAAGEGFAPVFMPPVEGLRYLGESAQEIIEQINDHFFSRLWMLLTEGGDVQKTAREIAARQEEKLIALGPVVEQLQDELLDPLIDRLFGIMLRNGLVPPVPEELEGQVLRVEYISVLHQAQKMLGSANVERAVGFLTQLARYDQTVLDNLNGDRTCRAYFDMMGVPPDLLDGEDEVAAKRQVRAQQQAAAQQQEAMAQAAKSASDLARADLESDNALSRLVGQFGPSAAAQAGASPLPPNANGGMPA
jgi:hypothetical protein